MTGPEDRAGADDHDDTRAPQRALMPPNHEVQAVDAPQRDHVQYLMLAITSASKQRSKNEAVIVSRLQDRADLYEKAYVQTKQAAIDALAPDAQASERHAQVDILRKANVEVLSPEMTIKLANLDARQYGTLRDPTQRVTAVLALADTARLSANYRTALARNSPVVAAAVERALAETEATKVHGAASAPSDQPGVQRDQPDPNASHGPASIPAPQAREHDAVRRAKTLQTATEQASVNSIEQASAPKREARGTQTEEKQAAVNRRDVEKAKGPIQPARGENQVQADEVFTAAQDEAKPIVPVEVEGKYLRVGRRYYHPKNTQLVAFEDKGNKLETRSNSEHIVSAMVAIARARGWDEIKVTGSETFRKEVWLEAGVHGMHVKGYTPSDADRTELAKRTRDLELHETALNDKPSGRGRRDRRLNSTSPEVPSPMVDKLQSTGQGDQARNWQPQPADRQRAQAFAQRASAEAVVDYPELAGAYAAVALIDKKVAADGLNARQRAAVMAQVRANLVNSIERGQLPEIQVREQVDVQRERVPAKEITR